MTSRYLLDASALLALVTGEPGEEKVRQLLAGHSCFISAVNLAEVTGKLCQLGMPLEATRETCSGLPLEVIPARAEHAWAAARLAVPGRGLGLSLGDRFCLGTALVENAVAVTADRQWGKLKGHPHLEFIR